VLEQWKQKITAEFCGINHKMMANRNYMASLLLQKFYPFAMFFCWLINKSVKLLALQTNSVPQFVYKSHNFHATWPRDSFWIKCNIPKNKPKHLLLAIVLAMALVLVPGQLPMKSLAKANNTQSHFDFGHIEKREEMAKKKCG